MANTDNDNLVEKLIADSRRLTLVNSRKRDHEEILKELTMFRNFSAIIHSDGSSSSKVFEVSVKVEPSGVASSAGFLTHSSRETAIINVQNISENFAFNPKYWQFVVSFENGESVNAFTIEKTLLPGGSETFCPTFSTDCNISPVRITVKLVFSLKFKSRHFVKAITLRRLVIDILHLLNPGKLFLSQMFVCTLSPNETANFSHLFHEVSKNDTKSLPAVTQFFLHFDSEMLRHFMDHIVLNDSLGRAGLSHEIIQDRNSLNPSLQVFYQAEEISISAKPKGPGVLVSFKSSNSKVLFAIRIAILRRLVHMSNIKVKCPDDKICEKLYDLKLRVENLERAGDSSDVEIADFMDVYLELREISEMIQFILLQDID